MLREPESKTPFWRSSWCGGLGCWWRSSRCRFTGASLRFGGEGALLSSPRHYSAVRSHQATRRRPVARSQGSGGRDLSPVCLLYQLSPNVSRARLFTRVRGRIILQTSPRGGSRKLVRGFFGGI